MKKRAVVFAGYFPTPASIDVGKEFVEYFKNHFLDCQFYIGLNDAACNDQFLALTAQSGLACETRTAAPELTIDSDASAYQAALALLRESGRRDFDYVYLFHSKGATNPQSKVTREFFLPLFRDRARIETVLDMDGIGSYSLFLSKSRDHFDDHLKDFFPFERPYFFTYLYFHTMYAFRAQPLLDFVHGCSPDFFSKKVPHRYFFELDFPHAIWRQGYAPFAEFLVDWVHGLPVGEVDVQGDVTAYLGRPLALRLAPTPYA